MPRNLKRPCPATKFHDTENDTLLDEIRRNVIKFDLSRKQSSQSDCNSKQNWQSSCTPCTSKQPTVCFNDIDDVDLDNDLYDDNDIDDGNENENICDFNNKCNNKRNSCNQDSLSKSSSSSNIRRIIEQSLAGYSFVKDDDDDDDMNIGCGCNRSNNEIMHDIDENICCNSNNKLLLSPSELKNNNSLFEAISKELTGTIDDYEKYRKSYLDNSHLFDDIKRKIKSKFNNFNSNAIKCQEELTVLSCILDIRFVIHDMKSCKDIVIQPTMINDANVSELKEVHLVLDENNYFDSYTHLNN